MPQIDAMTLLVVSDRAEDIKQTTICLRGFYPGCRVEAVYSVEEGVEWAAKEEWHVILLDEQFPARNGLDALPEIRRRAPNSAIIVRAERSDPARALQVMQAGADYYLCKDAEQFFRELPVVMREVLEKRDLRLRHESLQERYAGLVGALDEMVYELDDRGRFASVSDTLLSLLGYNRKEVIGAHYSKVLHPEDFRLAERRLDERRTGVRATRNLRVRLVPKHRPAARPAEVAVLVNAAGLYDRRQQFVGTVGIIRSLNGQGEEAGAAPPSVRDLLADTERVLRQLQRFLVEPPGAATETVSSSPVGERHEQEIEDAARYAGPSADIEGRGEGDRPPAGQTRAPATEGAAGASYAAPSSERRRWARSEAHLEATLSQDALVWRGVARNLSLGGVYLEFDGPIPAGQGQSIQLGIVSEVGVLEIKGRVQGVREAPTRASDQPGSSLVGLAIEFSPLGTVEELILASLLDELRERAGTVRITALLTPQDTGDLLLEVSASQKTMADYAPVYPGAPSAPGAAEPSDESQADRRLAPRVILPLPVQIHGADPSAPVEARSGHLINLSAAGACVVVSVPPERFGGRVELRVSLPPGLAGSSGEAPDQRAVFSLTADVLWATPESPPSGAPGSASFRLGLRFVQLGDEARRLIAEVVANLLASPDRVEPGAEAPSLISEPRECRNAQGQRIALYYDHRRDTLPPGAPVMILVPGYGETKKEYVTLAYSLAVNGFHVLRYDHTNHVGESEGDIEHSTLSRMRGDLSALLDYVERTWPASPVGLVATSLAGRVALKAAASDPRITLLVLLAGVVDVQATLLAVHQEDLVGSHLRGVRRGVINMLGFNIDADAWLADATENGYADLRTTVQDAAGISIPVILFTAEHDAWVLLDSVKAVHGALRGDAARLYVIPEALHRLHENPRKARAVFRQLATCCLERFYPLAPKIEPREPLQRDIGLQNRLERERARAQHQMAKTDMLEFWRDYLDHFHYIANVSDFWHLLDHVYRLMGDIQGGSRILDAGCGNGNFGMFLMVNHAYRQRHASTVDPAGLSYVGTDFVFGALLHARGNFLNVALKAGRPLASDMAVPTPLVTSLALSDLNMPLPFHDNQFDRIVCNLVIGYLQDPLFTVRELMRVLTPNGKLVITNLKPHSDLSQIYRNFVQASGRPEEVDEARRLLNNSGKIKQGESDGIFRFFDRQELAVLLESSGAARPRIYTTFANQAYIAVAEKPGTGPAVVADGMPSEPLAHA